MVRHAWVVSTLVGLWCGACQVSLSVPDGSSVTCETSADCTGTLVCSPAGRCVDPDLLDAVPPELEEIEVTPEVGRATTEFSFRLIPSEPLAELELILNLAEPVPLTCSDITAAETICSYTAVGNETAGIDAAVSFDVRLVDLSGNERRLVPAGVIAFDVTTPFLAAASEPQLVPGPSNQAPQPVAVRDDTTVRVAFVVNEALAGDPVLSTVPSGVFNWTRVSQGTTSFTYEGVLATGATPGSLDGSTTLQVNLEDPAGNLSGPLSLGEVTVDTLPPTAPDVDTQGVIELRRTPWGAAGEAASTRLIGNTGASTAALIRVYDDAQRTIVDFSPAADGSFDELLNTPDRVGVFVAAIDGAGNRSEIVRVRDGLWVATLGGKKPGSFLENPHLVVTTPIDSSGASAQDESELTGAQYDTLQAVGGGVPEIVETAATRWLRRDSSAAVVGRAFGSSAYDPSENVLWLYSGFTGSVVTNSIVGWNGENWFTPAVQGSQPAPRLGAAMTYIGSLGQFLVIGGWNIPGDLLDSWLWGSERWSLEETLTPLGPRIHSAMAYDPVNDQAVLFGGCGDWDCTIVMDDTWVWDPGTGVWSQPLTITTTPSSRAGHSMVYDPTNARMLMFGGTSADPIDNSPSSANAELWAYQDGDWQLLDDGTAPGSIAQRMFHGSVFDNDADALVVFGGRSTNCTPNFGGSSNGCGDLWRWAASSGWTELAEGPTEVSRLTLGMFYDDNNERYVFASGTEFDTQLYLGDTWVFDGTWDKIADSTGSNLGATAGHSVVYDTNSETTVSFGGYTTALNTPNADSFQKSLGGWEPVATTSDPSARSHAAMVFDSCLNRLIVYGGRGASAASPANDAFVRASGSTAWSAFTAGPSQRHRHTMVYMPGTCTGDEGIFLFGGFSNGSNPAPAGTYFYSGGAWNEVCGGSCTAEPAPRGDSAYAFDSVRNRVIIHGGRDPSRYDDTWEWNGSDWEELCTDPSCLRPGEGNPYFNAQMTFDASRGRAVLYGGEIADGEVYSDRTWEWNGADWSEVPTIGPVPPARFAAGAVFNPKRGRVTVVGGSASGVVYDDEWELLSPAQTQPAVHVEVFWGASGVSRTDMTGLSLDIYGGARGYDVDLSPTDIIGDAMDGLSVRVWNAEETQWEEITVNDATPLAPAVASYSQASASAVQALVPISSDVLRFKAVPRLPTGNGEGPSTVSLDYFEVGVGYRLAPLQIAPAQ